MLEQGSWDYDISVVAAASDWRTTRLVSRLLSWVRYLQMGRAHWCLVPPLVVVAMRDIDELLKQEAPKKEMTPEDASRAAHQEFLKQLGDFTPDADRLRWPKPIGPRWKN